MVAHFVVDGAMVNVGVPERLEKVGDGLACAFKWSKELSLIELSSTKKVSLSSL